MGGFGSRQPRNLTFASSGQLVCTVAMSRRGLWLSRGVGISRSAAGEQEARQRDHAAVRRLRRIRRIASQRTIVTDPVRVVADVVTGRLMAFRGPQSFGSLYFLDYPSPTQRTESVSGSVPYVLVRFLRSEDRLAVEEGNGTFADRFRAYAGEREDVG
jgi:hypothetical protein